MKKSKMIILGVFIVAIILVVCLVNQDEGFVFFNNKKFNRKWFSQERNGQKLEFKDFNKNATIKETVVVNIKEAKIVVKNLTYEKNEAKLDVCVENNSDKDLLVTAGTVGYSCNAINNYMLEDGYVNVEVPKGKEIKDTMSFKITNMQLHGINKISDMYVSFSIEDKEYNDIFKGGKLIKTSLYEKNDRDTYWDIINSDILEKEYNFKVLKVKKEKIKLKDGVEIVSQALVENKDKEKSVFVEIENKSKKLRLVSLNDVNINDINLRNGAVDREVMIPNSRVVIDISVEDLIDKDIKDLISLDSMNRVSYVAKLFNDKDEEYYTSKTIKFVGSKKSKDKEKKKIKDSKKVYDDKDIKIRYIGTKKNDYDEEHKFVFIVENDRKKAINLELVSDSVTVNKEKLNLFSLTRTIKGKAKGIYEFSIGYDELADKDIEKIKQLQFKVKIQNNKYEDIAKPKIKISL